MIWLCISIILFVIAGHFLSVSFNKLEFPDKRMLSFISGITIAIISSIVMYQFIIDCQNEAIIHYQNGDYCTIEKSNGDIVYKIIPTDYD